MFNNLIRPFRPRVDLAVSPERIAFISGDSELAFAPAARVNPDGKFLAVGEESYRLEEGRLVEFFAVPLPRHQAWREERTFTDFCRYVLLLGDHITPFALSPIVRVSDPRAIDRIWGRGGSAMLERCLRAAGAQRLSWVRPRCNNGFSRQARIGG